MECGSRQPQRAVTQNDDLLRPVGGGYPHPVLPPDLIGGPLNIGVRGLRLPGINHVDIVVLLHRALSALDLIGIKNQDHMTLAVALVVTQKVAQAFPGGIQTIPGDGLELIPGKNDVVSVYQGYSSPRNRSRMARFSASLS